MRAFVTGGTGLLGSNLVLELLAQGWDVRALARSEEKAKKLLPHARVEWVRGDMEDVTGFAHALEGVDVLFHTAAYFREVYGPGDHWGKLMAINVHGSEQLMRAAHARGVKRAVDTSSSGILGVSPGEALSDESTPPGPLQEANPYMKSKVLAEQALSKLSLETGFPISFVLPGWMFGPQDAAPTGAGQLVLDFLNRKLPGVLDGGSSVADARDVAKTMVAIAEKGRPRERYLASGPFASFADLYGALEAASGVPAPKRHIPPTLAVGVAFFSQTWAKLTGSSTNVTVLGVRTLQAKHRVSSAKAERELGVSFRPLRETVADTVQWMRGWFPVAQTAPVAARSHAGTAT